MFVIERFSMELEDWHHTVRCQTRKLDQIEEILSAAKIQI